MTKSISLLTFNAWLPVTSRVEKCKTATFPVIQFKLHFIENQLIEGPSRLIISATLDFYVRYANICPLFASRNDKTFQYYSPCGCLTAFNTVILHENTPKRHFNLPSWDGFCNFIVCYVSHSCYIVCHVCYRWYFHHGDRLYKSKR